MIRAIIFVLVSVGIGVLPDAADLSTLSDRIGNFEAAANAILGEES